MIDKQSISQWLSQRTRTKAIVCDIDETLCTQFDIPIQPAIELLRDISPPIAIFYLTARPEATKKATEAFLISQQLPFSQQLHLCPSWQTSYQHKYKKMLSFQQHYDVVLSIGDAEEDRRASDAAGIPFAQISLKNPIESWRQLAPTLKQIAETNLPK